MLCHGGEGGKKVRTLQWELRPTLILQFPNSVANYQSVGKPRLGTKAFEEGGSRT